METVPIEPGSPAVATLTDSCRQQTSNHLWCQTTTKPKQIQQWQQQQKFDKLNKLTKSLSESQSLLVSHVEPVIEGFSIFLKHFLRLSVCRIVFFQPVIDKQGFNFKTKQMSFMEQKETDRHCSIRKKNTNHLIHHSVHTVFPLANRIYRSKNK